jgi:hypothetical protein
MRPSFGKIRPAFCWRELGRPKARGGGLGCPALRGAGFQSSLRFAPTRGTERRKAQPVLEWTIPSGIAAPSGAPSRLSAPAWKPTPQLQAAFPGTRLRRALPGFSLSLVQRGARGAVVMPPERIPGAARERGHDPRPQAPRPLPLSRRPIGSAPQWRG